jgi:hypothetical protein
MLTPSLGDEVSARPPVHSFREPKKSSLEREIVNSPRVPANSPQPSRMLKKSFAEHGPAPHNSQVIDLPLWAGAGRCDRSASQKLLNDVFVSVRSIQSGSL